MSSLGSVTAQQQAAAASSTTSSSTSSSSSSSTSGQNALDQLSGNFQDFLQMLMTQLQNQDPTSPLDTNQFTQELVEFSGVEQQINTNASLSQLISLNQASEVIQGSALAGKTVSVNSPSMPLQDGSGSLSFTAPAAENVLINITNSTSQTVRSAIVSATAGQNTWTWNGQSNSGTEMPDGAYNVSITAVGTNAAMTSVPFTVSGTVTGVTSGTSGVNLQLGTLAVPFTNITSMK